MDSNENIQPFFPNFQQFRESSIPQEFAFSHRLIKYILMKPSSTKVYQKLIECCKTFFIENPVIFIQSLKCFWENEKMKNCKRKNCCKEICENGHDQIIFDKIQSKIWITEKFVVNPHRKVPNFISLFMTKIFRCEVQYLSLGDQILSFNDLKNLSAGVKECYLFYCSVNNVNGQLVPLEDIVRIFSGAKKFSMDFYSIPNNAVCKNYDDFFDACIKEINLYGIPNAFNISDFYQSLKKSKNQSLIYLHSSSQKCRVKKVIDEILQTETFDFVPPVINHNGFFGKKYEKMKAVQTAKKNLVNKINKLFS